jgi:predicted nuclease with RNAse H fold
MTSDLVIDTIQGLIDWRYARNRELEMLTSPGREAFCSLGTDWLSAAYRRRDSLRHALSDPRVSHAMSGCMVRATCSSIFSRNQFVNITHEESAVSTRYTLIC